MTEKSLTSILRSLIVGDVVLYLIVKEAEETKTSVAYITMNAEIVLLNHFLIFQELGVPYITPEEWNSMTTFATAAEVDFFVTSLVEQRVAAWKKQNASSPENDELVNLWKGYVN